MQKVNKPPTINFNELCQDFMNIVLYCCDILHQYSQNPSIQWKGTDNPVTQVDYLIQQFIVSKIKPKYDVNIVGEEDLSYKMCPKFKEDIEQKINQLQYTQSISAFPNTMVFSQEYQKDDICIWIDPLDCTQGFINNRKYEVTILVGISIKGVPVCGIIGHPYEKQKDSSVGNTNLYNPKVYFGSTLIPAHCAFEFTKKNKEWNTFNKDMTKNPSNGEQINDKIAIGYRKLCERQTNIMKAMKMTGVRFGGAGYKALKLIKRQVGSLMLVDMKTSKWDSCAGDAIVRAMGGYSIKPNLRRISYKCNGSIENKEGFFFTLDNGIYEKFISTIELI